MSMFMGDDLEIKEEAVASTTNPSQWNTISVSNVPAIMGSNWCVWCKVDKKEDKYAHYIYHGNSICEECLTDKMKCLTKRGEDNESSQG